MSNSYKNPYFLVLLTILNLNLVQTWALEYEEDDPNCHVSIFGPKNLFNLRRYLALLYTDKDNQNLHLRFSKQVKENEKIIIRNALKAKSITLSVIEDLE